ncbi:Inorganic pyrophosphatase [Enhygromyxa salina]|uniref:inorganic diphosphatase n=1 Tax=Enhygromyxa salina TaxID=215803 RepID=A0A0C2A3R4_9BACT|nr:inorganic pyrophosphatase [Enhygromyxa salina]KIG18023.1 Inorganic pyrophosphatase [Enhygromyxa salina]
MSFPAPFYRWRPHPWHGLELGAGAPRVVTAYIEITPFDAVKYELDKTTGYLRVDRPQRGSAMPPALYGFVPRTFCGERTAALTDGEATRGDEDPLDICVLSERPIMRSDIILNAKVLGGLQMIDNDEADDKLVAVLQNDLVWGECEELDDLPTNLVERLTHYFSTYKLVPGADSRARIARRYGFEHAAKVIAAAVDDYAAMYGE